MNNLSLQIPTGSIFGLLGPNGAGKTTFIRIITQILKPDAGRLLYKGERLTAKDSHHLGYLPEERGLYLKMKVREQLVYFATLKGISKKDASSNVSTLMDKFNLNAWADHKLETLSKGMQQKVQFIAAVAHEPKFLILDEPFSGFDPLNSEILTQQILEMKSQGCTILFSTHRMDTVESLCDYIGIIYNGRNILEGHLHTIKNSFRGALYEIEYSGILLPENEFYQIKDQYEKNGLSVATLSLEMKHTSNELLQYLLTHVHIHSYRARIPSIHEIFINKIKALNE